MSGDTFLSDPSIGHACNFATDTSCKYAKCRAERLSYTVTGQLRKMKERPQDFPKTIFHKAIASVYTDDALTKAEQDSIASSYQEKGAPTRIRTISRNRNL